MTKPIPKKQFIDATPKTYFLHSLRNAHLPQGVRTALCEFIDNSLGEGSGNARKVTLVYDSDNIAIIDNGCGMSDLAQMLTLGDSQNRLSSTDIGNFGYGSKIGALYLGWSVEIFTVNEKGEYRRASVDWKAQERNGSWQVPYDGKVLASRFAPAPIRKGGTMIIIRDRHDDRTWQWGSLAADLAHTYRPALDDGREIELVHRGGRNQTLLLSEYVERDVLKSQQEFSGSVNGKSFTVVAGERLDGAAGKPGVHIAYGHRVIETTKSLPETPLPAAFYAMVKLSPEWKKALGSNKTTIAQDRERLLAEVLELTKHIIDEIKEKSQEVRLDLINAQIAEEMSAALNEGGKRDLGALRYWEPTSWSRTAVVNDEDKGQDDKKKSSGLEIRLEDLDGHAVWDGIATGSKMTIQLNKQLKYIEQAYNNPLDPAAIWAMVASAIADLAEEDPAAARFLKLSEDDMDFIQNQPGQERRQMILHRILSKVPTVKEPTAKQIEVSMKGNTNG